MRVLWVKAPFVLRRHPPVLVAVIVMSALAALAVAATPLVRAGVQSESLKRQLDTMTPLSAGLEVTTGARVSQLEAQRASAITLGNRVRYLGAPVAAAFTPVQIAGSAQPGLEVMAMTRDGAVAHVKHVKGSAGPGVWVADAVAIGAHLHVGGRIGLTVHDNSNRTRATFFRIAGIYTALEKDRDNPYWANWQHEIRPLDPNDSPPPPFLLMDRASFARLAQKYAPSYVETRFEFPVDPAHITFPGAIALDHRFTKLRAEIERPGSAANHALSCDPRFCRTSSSLSAGLTIAATDVAAVGPTISLLSACGLLIALGLAVAAGVFLVRRRSDEAHVLFARGESPAGFAARTALEAALPGLLGLAIGLGVALLALRSLAPAGTISSGTVWSGGLRAVLASVAAVVCVAAGAVGAFPRRGGTEHAHRLRRIPWEVVPIAAGVALLALVLAGHGMAQDSTGATHPRLAVFVLPVLLVAGVAGLAVRGLRRALRRVSVRAAVVFLAVRRLAAARGLLVAVIVASATAFGTFAYSSTLSSSLTRSTDEKTFVGNGSNVQGYIDPVNTIEKPFGFPATLVQVDQLNVSTASGERIDLIAGVPEELRRTILWGDGWSDDPRPLLPRIEHWDGHTLEALATPDAPSTDAIIDQGKRIPVHIAARAPFPGTTAGRPALVVSWPVLRRIARKVHIFDPGPEATGLLWARGDPAKLLPVLDASSVAPQYMTTPTHIRTNVSVSAAARSYRYVRLIGAAAAVLALVALLLYLQARQRSLLIASALVRRMGLGSASDALALALEAAWIVVFAAAAGAAVAVAAARPIAHRLDALPQYAPAPVYIVPWQSLILAGVAATLAAAICGALATVIARRSNVSEALRVA